MNDPISDAMLAAKEAIDLLQEAMEAEGMDREGVLSNAWEALQEATLAVDEALTKLENSKENNNE